MPNEEPEKRQEASDATKMPIQTPSTAPSTTAQESGGTGPSDIKDAGMAVEQTAD